jgi:hypothetical protein
LLDCACDTGCPADCDGLAPCIPTACGFNVGDDTCNACMEATCCDQIGDCSSDATCSSCTFDATPPAACQSNPPFAALSTCLIQGCAFDCGAPACGFDNGGACGACLNGTCCEQGRACYIDDLCYDCALGNGIPGVCAGSPQYAELRECLATCSGDPCGTAGTPPEPPEDDPSEGDGGEPGSGGAAVTGDAGEPSRPDGGSDGEGGAAGESSNRGGRNGAVAEGADAAPEASGCACRSAPSTRNGAASWWLAALFLTARRRRGVQPHRHV